MLSGLDATPLYIIITRVIIHQQPLRVAQVFSRSSCNDPNQHSSGQYRLTMFSDHLQLTIPFCVVQEDRP
jgi:hypothetical protein